LAADFLAAGFAFAADFLAAGFLAADFLAAGFAFAADFLAAGFLAAFAFGAFAGSGAFARPVRSARTSGTDS